MVAPGLYCPDYSQRALPDNIFTSNQFGLEKFINSPQYHAVNNNNNNNSDINHKSRGGNSLISEHNCNSVIQGDNCIVRDSHPLDVSHSVTQEGLAAEGRGRYSMSSYLPLRHTGAHAMAPNPRSSVGGDDNVMHGISGVVDSGGYMDHFLNIPEICPSGGYRNPRYYVGAYNAEACRMEALQQQHHRTHHDFRMGLQGSRTPFYQNMNMGIRFGENMEAHVGANCLPAQNRGDAMSPCTKAVAVAADNEAPSFYPWMSIVGEYCRLSVCLSEAVFVRVCLCFWDV